MRFRMKYAGAVLFTACVTSVSAIPFDTTTVDGIVEIGFGKDYNDLTAAATAFNGLQAPFIQGNWTLLIVSDLQQLTNVGFANTVPDNSSITIKPGPGAVKYVNFVGDNTNAGGPEANFVIGLDHTLKYTGLKTTKNFTIDGSNNGTNSKDLYIRGTSGKTTLLNLGDTDNVVFKNLTIDGATAAPTQSFSCASIIAYYDGTNYHLPKHAKIVNNIVRNTSNISYGIGLSYVSLNNMTLPSNFPGIENFEIRNNSVRTTYYGILAGALKNGIIDGNEITMDSSFNIFGSQKSVGVSINSNYSSAATLDITNNKIITKSNNTMSQNESGHIALQIQSSNAVLGANIFNNMINFNFTSAANTNPMIYNGMVFTGRINGKVYHNSINMPNFPNLQGIVTNKNGLSSAIKLPQDKDHTFDIKNNILRVDQAGSSALHSTIQDNPVISRTLTSNNNVIFRSRTNSPTAFYGNLGYFSIIPENLTSYLTLANWQDGTSQDANSQSVDPTTTTGSKWHPSADSADLHFVPQVAPNGIAKVARLAEVPNDIDGTPRAAMTLPGADDAANASVGVWELY